MTLEEAINILGKDQYERLKNNEAELLSLEDKISNMLSAIYTVKTDIELEKLNKEYEALPKMQFGKYKSYAIKDVINTDPKYIQWAIDNVKNFQLNDEYKELLKQSIKKHRDEYNKYHILARCYDNVVHDDDEYYDDFEADMRGCFDPNY